MKITIDTNDVGIIDITGSYSLDELIIYLSKLYPDFTWKTLESTTSLRLRMPPSPLPDDDSLPF